jgi:ferredoxin
MSKKDGKATLLNSVDKKGFHTAHVDNAEYDDNVRAANACPVNIIKVKMT